MIISGIGFLVTLGFIVMDLGAMSALSMENGMEDETLFHFIAIVPKYDGDPYFGEVVKGFQEAGTEERSVIQVFEYDRLTGIGSLTNTMKMCEALMPDGLIVSIPDSAGLKDSVASAVEANIPVVTLESDFPGTKRAAFIGTNVFEAGMMAGSFVATRAKEKTETAIVVSQMNDEVTARNNTFAMGFLKGASSNALVSLAMVKPMEEGVLSSENVMRNLILESPQIDLVIFPGARDTEGAAQTLIDLNKVGRISLIGFDESEGMKALIDQGVVLSTIVRNPRVAGRRCVESLIEINRTGRTNSYVNPGLGILTQNGVWKGDQR